MHNNIKIAFFFILLNLSSLFAQEVSKSEFDKMVDYVNCKYIEDLIKDNYPRSDDEYKKNNNTKYIVKYRKNIFNITKNISLENASITDLSKVLNKNTESGEFKRFNDIKGIKESFKERKSKSELINIIEDECLELGLHEETIMNIVQELNSAASRKVLSGSQNTRVGNCMVESIKFRNKKEKLKVGDTKKIKYILKPQNCDNTKIDWYSSNPEIISVNQSGEITAKIEGESEITARIKGKEVERKIDVKVVKKKGLFQKWYVLLFLGLFGFILYKKRSFFMNTLKKNKENENIISNNNSDNIEQNKAGINSDNTEILEKRIKEQQLEINILKDIERENEVLHLRVKKLEQELRKYQKKSDSSKSIKKNESNEKIESNKNEMLNRILYADAIVDSTFYKVTDVPNEDTVFELLVSNNLKIVSFKVYKESFKRVLINPDFVDGCEKHKLSENPQDLEVIPGEAQIDSFGKWRITKSAVVKFV